MSQKHAAAAVYIIITLICIAVPVRVHALSSPKPGCQCTDYVYRQRKDIPHGMGHARDWSFSANQLGLPTDNLPQIGDAVVILNGEFGFNAEYGHVAMVIGVNREHTRFDIAGWDGMRSDCRTELYTNLPVTSNTIFIHHSEPLYH